MCWLSQRALSPCWMARDYIYKFLEVIPSIRLSGVHLGFPDESNKLEVYTLASAGKRSWGLARSLICRSCSYSFPTVCMLVHTSDLLILSWDRNHICFLPMPVSRQRRYAGNPLPSSSSVSDLKLCCKHLVQVSNTNWSVQPNAPCVINSHSAALTYMLQRWMWMFLQLLYQLRPVQNFLPLLSSWFPAFEVVK